jgi:hypothetical protein
LSLGSGTSLWYLTPIYVEGDGTRCPGTGGNGWLEAGPHHGRFETGPVLRIHEIGRGRPWASIRYIIDVRMAPIGCRRRDKRLQAL